MDIIKINWSIIKSIKKVSIVFNLKNKNEDASVLLEFHLIHFTKLFYVILNWCKIRSAFLKKETVFETTLGWINNSNLQFIYCLVLKYCTEKLMMNYSRLVNKFDVIFIEENPFQCSSKFDQRERTVQIRFDFSSISFIAIDKLNNTHPHVHTHLKRKKK